MAIHGALLWGWVGAMCVYGLLGAAGGLSMWRRSDRRKARRRGAASTDAGVSPLAQIDDRAQLAAGCTVQAGAVIAADGGAVTLAEGVHVGHYAVLSGAGGLTVGANSIIGPHAVLAASNHRFERLDVPINVQGRSAFGIVIEEDVWIGPHAVVADGVRIGRGGVIAPGAIVTSDVEPYAVVGDMPAQVIGSRLADPTEHLTLAV